MCFEREVETPHGVKPVVSRGSLGAVSSYEIEAPRGVKLVVSLDKTHFRRFGLILITGFSFLPGADFVGPFPPSLSKILWASATNLCMIGDS